MFPYDKCFFITKDGDKNFGIVGFQIDNTFNVKTEAFMKKKETEIIKAKFKTKTQTILKPGISGNFNNGRMTIKAEAIMVIQKNKAEKLALVNIKDNIKK